MTERTIARRYVRALFELALEQGDAEAVAHDLAALLARLAKEPQQLAALLDPRATIAAKHAAVDRLFEASAKPLTRDFARFVIDRRREQVLALAADEFAAMLREQRGEAIAEVVSAAPLGPAEREALLARLGELTKRKIALQEQVDPALLGGMRVKVGSMLLDGSARRRLAGMKDDLLRVAMPQAAAGAS